MSDAFPNPLSGRPDVVSAEAEKLIGAADSMARAADALRQLRGELFRSLAIDAIAGKAEGTAGAVSRAHGRYVDAGEALRDYGAVLGEVQPRSFDVAREAAAIEEDRARIDRQWDDRYPTAAAAGPDQLAAIDDLNRLNQERAVLDQRRGALAAEWAELSRQKEAAAVRAMNRIRHGNDASDLDDSFWDDLSSFVGDLIPIVKLLNKILQVILKIVSIVLTVLAVIFVVLGFFFPPLAGIGVVLFGYARLVDLVIAALVLLQVLMEGLNLLDVLVAVAAVAATLIGGAAASLAGSFAKGVLSGLAAAGAIGDLAAKALVAGLQQGINLGTAAVVDGILDLSDGARDLYNGMMPTAGSMFDGIAGGALGSLGSGLEQAGADLGSAVGDAAGDALGDVGDALSGAFGGVGGALGGLGGLAGGVVSGAQGAIGALGDAAGGALGALGDLADSSGVSGVVQDAVSTGSAVYDGAAGVLDQVLDSGGRQALDLLGVDTGGATTGRELLDHFVGAGAEAAANAVVPGGMDTVHQVSSFVDDPVAQASNIVQHEASRLVESAVAAAGDRLGVSSIVSGALAGAETGAGSSAGGDAGHVGE